MTQQTFTTPHGNVTVSAPEYSARTMSIARELELESPNPERWTVCALITPETHVTQEMAEQFAANSIKYL
ncbi:hypothetical protein BGL48_11995 [Salinivibrio sp. SS3]|uniref:Uncharacterized protein n=1 Tax=Salinivibrio phage SMHB1 TaxID=1897436 RepID=A0A1D9C9S7_9CAUD|nr:hypothetical protein [Salinivibrio sp. BNH]YP_009786953.1 hypothetical protein HOR26_gp11 [Salinivibrio phage SMHB1]AOY11816.1 hypothetical protein [Salinivibrio phage SMHB1]ODP98296.1 hypothetical protein BGL48_11995 [Salinivibrio sp. BNH]